MTNFEKYKKDIMRILAVGDKPALVKGELIRCGCAECEDCGFNGDGTQCSVNYLKWGHAEAEEPAFDRELTLNLLTDAMNCCEEAMRYCNSAIRKIKAGVKND